MKKKKDIINGNQNGENVMFFIFCVAFTMLIIIFVAVFFTEIHNMIQDHKCYIGEETREEICRRWR